MTSPLVTRIRDGSLPDYARVRPHWVQEFVLSRGAALSPLSRREALKRLGG